MKEFKPWNEMMDLISIIKMDEYQKSEVEFALSDVIL